MYDRFSDDGRGVMTHAREAALERGDDCIDPAHILLGLIPTPDAAGTRVLRALGADPDAIVTALKTTPPAHAESPQPRALPFTPAARNVLEAAAAEAEALRHTRVGTGHLVLGLLREPRSRAGQALRDAGLEPETVREALRGES